MSVSGERFVGWGLVTGGHVSTHLLQAPPHGLPVVVAGPSPPFRAEDVDRTLQRQEGGVESALLYAKAWSKYTKELLAWVEKRLSMGELGHRCERTNSDL